MPSCTATKPSAPTNLQLVQLSSCSAEFKWQLPPSLTTKSAPVLTQQLRAVVASGTLAEAAAILADVEGGDSTEAALSGLQSKAAYSITVRQRNALGWSAPSAAISLTTEASSNRRTPSRP
eukprot:281321-Prymnesium_polylepis.1